MTYLYVDYSGAMFAGMWEATDAFCRESDVDNIFVQIGDKECGEYKTCLIMIKDGQIVLDKTFGIDTSIYVPGNRYTMGIELSDDIEIMPQKMTCDIDMTAGTMNWHHDDKLYGSFVRTYTS